jgi:hypothetical protein
MTLMHFDQINSIEFEYVEWNLNWIPIQLNSIQQLS